MPSPKLRLLQDESVAIEKEITDLRSLEPKDDAEKAGIEERLAAKMKRADEIAVEAEREHEIDKRLAKMQGVRNQSGTKEQIEGEARGKAGDGEKPKRSRVIGGLREQPFSTETSLALAAALRDMARGKFEVRDMGSTSPTYDDAGAELVMNELYPEVINQLNYTAACPTLAFSLPVAGNSATLPKAGDIIVDIVDEDANSPTKTVATSTETVVIYDLRAEVPIGNNLFEDSPVAIPPLVTRTGGRGFARRIDDIWLNGHVGKSIDGLVDLIDSDHTVDLDGDEITARHIAQLVGKPENIIGEAAWVCTAAGWGKLLEVYASQLGTMTVGGGRVVMSILGAPVYKVEGLPAGVYALYGDFSSATAFGYKPSGFRMEALREVGYKKNQTIFHMVQRVGWKNHGPEFVAKLVDSSVPGFGS